MKFLFFLTCFLFNIRDALVMTQFKTLDCLQELVTAAAKSVFVKSLLTQ